MTYWEILFCRSNLSIGQRVALVLTLLFTLITAVPTFASGSVTYVKWDAGDSNNGTSWGNIYTDLRSALPASGMSGSFYIDAFESSRTTFIGP